MLLLTVLCELVTRCVSRTYTHIYLHIWYGTHVCARLRTCVRCHAAIHPNTDTYSVAHGHMVMDMDTSMLRQWRNGEGEQERNGDDEGDTQPS